MIASNLNRLILGIALGLVVSTTAFAQYGGGGGTGTGTQGGTPGGPVYTPPKGGYSSSTGAIVGASVAAGAVGVYLLIRSRRSVVGCVEKSTDGINLMSEKDHKTYALDAANLDLKTGDRVKLTGKKTKSSSGAREFTAKKLVKDYGSCQAEAALKHPVVPSR